jgi:hypothetical protein
MEQTNELRIGNYLTNKGGLVLARVCAIRQDGITCNHLDEKTQLEENQTYCPIDLKEDWFLRFGFDKGIYWRKDWLQIQQSGNEFTLYIPDDYVGQEYGEPFKYVHQLQNLFFALTKTELTLKEI